MDGIFQHYVTSADAELQQRVRFGTLCVCVCVFVCLMAWSCVAYSINADAHPSLQALEYKTLHERNDQGLLDNVFDVMPVFPERESALLKRIKKVRSTRMLDPWVLCGWLNGLNAGRFALCNLRSRTPRLIGLRGPMVRMALMARRTRRVKKVIELIRALNVRGSVAIERLN